MVMSKVLKRTAIAAGMAVFGLIFGWVLFPLILKSQLKKEMALTKKTDVRKMWEVMPFPLDFKVYLFNYTNPEEVQKGGIPIVKEIGPFHFDDWKVKLEIEDNEENDTVSYKAMDTYYFRPDLSAPGLTGEEVLTIPHLFILGTILTVSREKPAMLSVIGKGLNGIFDNPPDVFLRVKVLDILFRGVKINCTRTEFAPKAICSHLKKEGARGLVAEGNDQYRFSLFGNKNHTIDPQVITVRRGKKNVKDVGSMVAINGKTHLGKWRDACDKFDGTDNTIFPPFFKETDRILTFSINLCRPFRPWYQKKTSYSGIRTYHYYANVGDFANDPELNCFCDAPDKCLAKGLMDLYNCIGVPLFASLPHFADCDPKLLEDVKGLHPDVEVHGIRIDFEPISGTPMEARQRMQFNLRLMKTEKMELLKNLSNSIVPVFWVDEGLALNKTFVNMLKHQLFLPKRIVNVLRWSLVTFGGCGCIVGLIIHYRDRLKSIVLSKDIKITPEEGEVKQTDEEQRKNISVIGGPAKIDM